VRKSNMEITVTFLAGTSFQDACEEAKDYAIKNNLAYVRFDFNGIHIAISQRADVDKACEKFMEALKEDSKFKWVIA
jgi:hypothetical protein